MYHYLEGRLVEKNPTSIVLDVNGVGFYLQAPLSTFSGLPAVGERVKLLTHFVVREDAQMLFGFRTEEERELFRLLISVSGIGPKVAMTALSGVSIYDLKRAIAESAVHVLTGISGIGKKTAERLIVELKEKMVLETRLAPAAESSVSRPVSDKAEDTLQALVSLGYTKGQARAAVDKALKEPGAETSVETLVRKALKHI